MGQHVLFLIILMCRGRSPTEIPRECLFPRSCPGISLPLFSSIAAYLLGNQAITAHRTQLSSLCILLLEPLDVCFSYSSPDPISLSQTGQLLVSLFKKVSKSNSLSVGTVSKSLNIRSTSSELATPSLKTSRPPFSFCLRYLEQFCWCFCYFIGQCIKAISALQRVDRVVVVFSYGVLSTCMCQAPSITR